MQNPLESQMGAPAPAAQKLSPLMQGLVQLLRNQSRPSWTGPRVHVTEVTAGAHFLYEQLRNAVEYREQHLFIRGAIERFLIRELKSSDPDGVGFELVSELTKTRYLKNDTVREDEIKYLDFLVERYAVLQRAAMSHGKPDEESVSLAIIQLLSVELERALLPGPTDAAIVEFTYASFIRHADVHRDDQLALYAAVHKALLKSDVATIRYGVFSRAFPRWLEDDDQLAAAGEHFSNINDELAEKLAGNKPHRMFRLVRRHIAPYLILREIIKTSTEGLEQLANTPSVLMEKARSVAEQQYQVVSHRLKRSIIQAVIFLFITKVIVGMLIEIPYELFVYGTVATVPLVINLLFPACYMALVGLGIKIPGKRNTTKILSDLKLIVYESEQPLAYSLRSRGRRSMTRTGFNFIYFLTTFATLAAIAYILNALGFNIVSAIIFFIFLSTVSFFAYRISYSVREYAVIEEEAGFFTSLTDFLLTPFIRIGQWLAERYSRINIFTAVLDIIIETPFKTILRIIEQWNAFLRDKRDDVLR